MSSSLPTVSLLGLPIVSAPAHALHRHLSNALSKEGQTLLFTPNAEMLCRAEKDPTAHRLLSRADLLIPDGVGLLLYAKARGTPLSERIPGIEVGEWSLQYAAEHGLSVFLLGGNSGVAEQAAKRLGRRFGGLRIVGTHHGYFGAEEEAAVLRRIREAEPQILMVCMGFPRQEAWILAHGEQLPSLRLAMGLGGALDVWSGQVRRAPQPLRRMGLEWLWRILANPTRVGRLRFLIPYCRMLATAKKKASRGG